MNVYEAGLVVAGHHQDNIERAIPKRQAHLGCFSCRGTRLREMHFRLCRAGGSNRILSLGN